MGKNILWKLLLLTLESVSPAERLLFGNEQYFVAATSFAGKSALLTLQRFLAHVCSHLKRHLLLRSSNSLGRCWWFAAFKNQSHTDIWCEILQPWHFWIPTLHYSALCLTVFFLDKTAKKWFVLTQINNNVYQYRYISIDHIPYPCSD